MKEIDTKAQADSITIDDLLGKTRGVQIEIKDGQMIKVFSGQEQELPDNWHGRLTVTNADQVARKIEHVLTGKRFSIVFGMGGDTAETYQLSYEGEPDNKAVQPIIDDDGLGTSLLIRMEGNGRNTILTCAGGCGDESDPETFNPYFSLDKNEITISQIPQNQKSYSWKIRIF